ncbi:MAG: YdcH family protein [Novosphingobium sp.]
MESTHISALQMKHAGLEKQIESEMSRPLPDEALVAQLKRKKLRIKEELARLH